MSPRRRHPHRAIAAASLGVLVVLAVSGCSGEETDASLALAEAQVAAKEKALTEAESEAAAAKAAFCSSSTSYITALDRYGDILNATAPTVGDVRDAGKDLEEPGDEAVSAGEASVAAQEEVARAEQELADAQAELAAAQASADGTTPTSEPSSESPSPSPTQTPASVTRVQEAEAELDAAQAGITDSTPLDQAAEQFNAAAVALEVAWLQLVSEAGCLSDEQQAEAVDAVTAYTKTLQQALTDAGFYDGKVDGVYGPSTVDAVQALQKANGLPQTGTVDKATEQALQDALAAVGGAAAQEDTATTAAVQQTLKLAGYWDGPVDGVWTDELTDALMEFQSALGVEPTGTVDAATVAALEKAIAEAGTPAPPSPSASVGPSASPTS